MLLINNYLKSMKCLIILFIVFIGIVSYPIIINIYGYGLSTEPRDFAKLFKWYAKHYYVNKKYEFALHKKYVFEYVLSCFSKQ